MPLSSNLLDFLSPGIPIVFQSDQTREHLQRLAQRFPQVSAGWLECRLACFDRDLDCGLMLRPSQFRLHDFQQARKEADPSWFPLLHLQRALSTDASIEARVFSEAIEMIGMEFDLPESVAVDPVPLPFLALRSSIARDHALSGRVLRDALSLFGCTELAPLAQGVLRRMPDSVSLDQFGVLAAREPPALRLNLGGFSPGAMARFLLACDWPGDPQRLLHDLRPIASRCHAIELCLDLHRSGISARLGLECFGLSPRPLCQGDGGDLLDHLIALGLCSPARCDALRAWTAALQWSDHRKDWPEGLRAVQSLFSGNAVLLIRRWLNHIKLIYADSGWREAKGYLFYAPAFQAWPPPTHHH